MPKSSTVSQSLPPVARTALAQLGAHLAVARKRRKESQRAWALRIGVSVPTLIRMEQGDAAVGMGVYASALWLMGRVQALADLAAPATDLGALEQDIRAAQARAVRSPESVTRRLRAAAPAAQPQAAAYVAPNASAASAAPAAPRARKRRQPAKRR